MKRTKTKPVTDPNCKNCRGKGAYPLHESNGLLITIRQGSTKGQPIPCRECWTKHEGKNN